MKTAIVTGASGFVGGAVLRELLANDYKVYAVVREGRDRTLPADARCVPVFCDLTEMKSLTEKITAGESSIFYHFAWAGVEPAQRSDTRLQLDNAQWTVDCVRIAKYLGCSRFVCAGSIMEYESMAAAYTQGNKPGLSYIYGGGKLAAHAMCMSIAASINIDIIWASITNAYGVGEYSSRLITSTMKKCIQKKIPKFTSGTQNYDFVYIDDVARAFRLIGEKGKPFHEYIIGSGTARPLRDFLLEMKSVIAPDLDFVFGDIPFTGVNLPLSRFDCSYTENDTGFRARINFTEGCRRTFDWWKHILNLDNKI